MHAAVDIAMDQTRKNPDILPNNLTAEDIQSLLAFSLDNAYLEYDSHYFSENIGCPKGLPLL